MNDIILALQTTQYLLKRLHARNKLVGKDERMDLYITDDEGKRIYVRDLPVCVIPLVYKLRDYEQLGLNPDELSVLIERWKDV